MQTRHEKSVCASITQQPPRLSEISAQIAKVAVHLMVATYLHQDNTTNYKVSLKKKNPRPKQSVFPGPLKNV